MLDDAGQNHHHYALWIQSSNQNHYILKKINPKEENKCRKFSKSSIVSPEKGVNNHFYGDMMNGVGVVWGRVKKQKLKF